ncbi:MAG: hypothetical protein WD078_01180 [Woeseia sp.]
MHLPAISSAIAVALAAALAFACVAAGYRVLVRRFGTRLFFDGIILTEAAHRLRVSRAALGRRQASYFAAALVFGLVLGIFWLLQPDPLLAPLPRWVHIAVVTAACLVGIAALYQLGAIARRRSRLRHRRDASMIVGHSLQKLCGNMNRVFHDVPCSAGIVDHVVAGLHGIYAIKVLSRRPGKDSRIRLQDDSIVFASRHEPVPIGSFKSIAARLGRECSKAVKHDVHVRCVIAVPGWEVTAQSGNDILVVNERNISMIGGWKDQRDFLMNEDIEVVHELLTARCIATPPVD